MKKLLLGNAAVAQGAYEAGVHFVSSYPGTPSTEITECMATYPADEVFVEWAPNEHLVSGVGRHALGDLGAGRPRVGGNEVHAGFVSALRDGSVSE